MKNTKLLLRLVTCGLTLWLTSCGSSGANTTSETAPQLAYQVPASIEELPLNGSITLHFDQPMDRQSVEDGLSVDPSIPFRTEWQDDLTLEIDPETGALSRAARYRVTVGKDAKSRDGVALDAPIVTEVRTVGFLNVTEVIPAPGAASVDPDSVITVLFNRPIVPLSAGSGSVDLPHPLHFEPGIPGRGEWLNTSIYMWRPAHPLTGGQEYHVTIDPDILASTDAIMQQPFDWGFSTLAPAVGWVDPARKERNVPLDGKIEVSFNQAMDHSSVEAGFSLTGSSKRRYGDNSPGSWPVRGSFEWNEDGDGLIFTPDQPLDYDSVYEVRVGESARAQRGSMFIGADTVWRFETVRAPAVVGFVPANGKQDVSPVRGWFYVAFASPMDRDTLTERLVVQPPLPEHAAIYYDDIRQLLMVEAWLEPSTEYTVTLLPGAADPYGRTINRPYTFHFKTGPFPALVTLSAQSAFNVYDVRQAPELLAFVRNVDRIDLELAHLNREDFWKLFEDPELFHDFQPDRGQVVRSWSITTRAPLNIGYNWRVTLKKGDGKIPDAGIYLLTLRSPDLEYDLRKFIFLTNANVTAKTSFKESLAWVTDLRTGTPLDDVGVTFYDKEFHQAGRGQTGPDGVVEVSTSLQSELVDPRAIIAQGAGIFGISLSSWSGGVDPWSVGVPFDSSFRSHGLYLYTDRPLYRPGQEVHFKGILRNKDDLAYSLPDSGDVLVTIQSPDGETVYSESLPVSDFGTLDGVLTLGPEASTGYYRIEYRLKEDGDESGKNYIDVSYFWVAEYEKPQFTVTVTPEHGSVNAGDPASVTIDAHHYFGGPVERGWVSWKAFSAPHRFEYDGPERFSFLNYDREQPLDDASLPGYSQMVAEGEGWLDKDGNLVVEIPTDLAEFDSSQEVSIDVLVGDGAGQWVSGQAKVVVHKSATYVGVRPGSYVGTTGAAQTGYVIALDPGGRPVADQAVKIQVMQRRWYSVQEETDTGHTYWTSDFQETTLSGPRYVTTDEQGRAEFTFVPPAGGSYKLVATVSDAVGRTVTSSAYMWTGSADYNAWARRNSRAVQVVPDKSSYKPGDTARILIASPFADRDVHALVTVERGSILYHRVITLSDSSYVFELPVTADFAPNAYVSVVLLQDAAAPEEQPDFRVGYAEIQVESVRQALQVSLTADKTEAKPNDSLTYTIKTRDASGKPVDAEVSLALVDLATLSLRDDSKSALVDYFYRKQYLGVVTSLSLVNLVDPIDKALLDQAKGGGGGGAEGFYDIRSDFKDTAYWRAAVRTGAEGSATVTVTLPDNLTTWRMDARAVTAGTLVGQTTVDVVAAKPLMVLPVTPRFFVAGDEAALAAIVYNRTSKDVETTVSLEAGGVTLHADTVQRVTIPARGQTRVEWPVTVDPDSAWIDLAFGAEGGGLSDFTRPLLGDPDHGQGLPVYRFTAPDTVGTAGQLGGGGTRVEHIVLPPGNSDPQGEVDVRIDNSLAASMLDGLAWLEHYPYECTEQTVSRFLPNALTLNALRQVGRSDPELEARLKTQLDVGVQKLYSQQHVDGGWGWFVDRESQPGVTAYVVQGLLAAKAAGYPVDQGRLDRAVEYLRGHLHAVDALMAVSDRNRQVYVLYVLAKSGQPDVSRTVQTYDTRTGLDLWARALLAQTLWMIAPDDPRLDTLKSDLVNAAKLSATGAHWEEAQADYWNWNTDTRSTAIVLDTFALLWPDSDLSPNITRWLMVNRTGGHWSTTQETAWALIALTDWMVATGELEANYRWSLSLNGNSLADGTADTSTIDDSHTVTFDAADLSAADTNRLAFQRSAGAGLLYYTAHLTLYQPVESVAPLSRGIVVTRRYIKPDGKTTVEGQVGDVLTVEVTVVAPDALHYVVIDDYYPAGAEAVNQDFNTTGSVGQRPYLSPDDPLVNGWGWWWFSHVDLRDEKAQIFADFLPAGTYQFIYKIRLTVPGKYHVLPPTAQEFYFPEIFGRGSGTLFDVLASDE